MGKWNWLYQVIRWLVWFFYPDIEVVGKENLPDEPAIIVGNHSQMNGPIACELYPPRKSYTWCAAQMMHWKEVPEYAFSDFWSRKPRYTHWFYKLLSYIITPISVSVFNNANTIAVYHDTRIISTFKNTVKRLQEGEDVIIFPEQDVPHNAVVCRFQDKFIDVAKLYYKRTGKCLSFVPMYIAPRLKKMYLGKPISYDPDIPIQHQRKEICDYLMEQITAIACELPKHTVVPYRNIPRRLYSSNKECTYEKTGG